MRRTMHCLGLGKGLAFAVILCVAVCMLFNNAYATASLDGNDSSAWLQWLQVILYLVFNVFPFLFFLLVGYYVGRWNEKKHFKHLKEQEAKFAYLPAIPNKLETILSDNDIGTIAYSDFVMGSVVISEDFFKRMLASLKSMFGGNIASYESLLDRGRREALIRMKHDAVGADMIVNVRLETASIGKGRLSKNDVACVDIVAYGTAIRLKK